MRVKELDIAPGRTGKIILKKYRLTRILESWVEINTTNDKAWAALVDFASWPNWNSFIPEVEGKLKVDNEMGTKVRLPGFKEMNFKPTVMVVEKGKKLVWGGSAGYIRYRGVQNLLLRI